MDLLPYQRLDQPRLALLYHRVGARPLADVEKAQAVGNLRAGATLPDGGQGLSWQPVTAWAGPWPTDEGWWSGGSGPSARFQVVGADGRAWLLVRAPDGWSLEAGYD